MEVFFRRCTVVGVTHTDDGGSLQGVHSEQGKGRVSISFIIIFRGEAEKNRDSHVYPYKNTARPPPKGNALAVL